jgi:hypothetical protein
VQALRESVASKAADIVDTFLANLSASRCSHGHGEHGGQRCRANSQLAADKSSWAVLPPHDSPTCLNSHTLASGQWGGQASEAGNTPALDVPCRDIVDANATALAARIESPAPVAWITSQGKQHPAASGTAIATPVSERGRADWESAHGAIAPGATESVPKAWTLAAVGEPEQLEVTCGKKAMRIQDSLSRRLEPACSSRGSGCERMGDRETVQALCAHEAVHQDAFQSALLQQLSAVLQVVRQLSASMLMSAESSVCMKGGPSSAPPDLEWGCTHSCDFKSCCLLALQWYWSALLKGALQCSTRHRSGWLQEKTQLSCEHKVLQQHVWRLLERICHLEGEREASWSHEDRPGDMNLDCAHVHNGCHAANRLLSSSPTSMHVRVA